MTVTLIFFLIMVGAALWWLLQQELTAKPWLHEGVASGRATGTLSYPAAKVALWLLLAVITSLFALLIGAYFMRMGFSDWRSLQIPRLLWLNTAALVLASVFLQIGQAAVHRSHMESARLWLLIGGVFGVAFVAGQLRAWDQLRAAGEIISLNPANGFFYLLTGLHGLHVLGGLVVLGVTADRVFRHAIAERARLTVELCATYWHFLLVVWLVLFGLLTGGADDLGKLCSQLIS